MSKNTDFPGGNDEDCRRKDKVLEQPGICQPDEEEPKFVDWTVLRLITEKNVCIIVQTLRKCNSVIVSRAEHFTWNVFNVCIFYNK